MIAAIVGSRKGLNWSCVKKGIGIILARDDIGTIVSGGALGVDRLAESMALAAGKRSVVFLPDWDKLGRRAGFVRNAKIVETADEVFAFWDGQSRGTAHTIALAKKAGKPVHVLECP